jgi:hypothetical protein
LIASIAQGLFRGAVILSAASWSSWSSARRGVNDLEPGEAVGAGFALGEREHERDVACVGDADRLQHEHASHRAMSAIDAARAIRQRLGPDLRQLGDPVDRLSGREHYRSMGARVAGVACRDRVELRSEARERFLHARDRLVDRPTVCPRCMAQLLRAVCAGEVAAKSFGLIEADQPLEAESAGRVVDSRHRAARRIPRPLGIENHRRAVAGRERV